MKEIKLPHCQAFAAFDGPTEYITPELGDAIMAEVNAIKLAIYGCAEAIESLLEAIATSYFFGQGGGHARVNFENWILKSNWCSFAAKRTLALTIIKESSLLSNPERARLEKLLKSAMSYRNAFTHGTMWTDGRTVRVSYYEGAPREQPLTDAWLSQIECEMRECFELVMKAVGHQSPSA